MSGSRFDHSRAAQQGNGGGERDRRRFAAGDIAIECVDETDQSLGDDFPAIRKFLAHPGIGGGIQGRLIAGVSLPARVDQRAASRGRSSNKCRCSVTFRADE